MVRWADPAKQDLAEIADFIACDDIAMAKRVVNIITTKAETLHVSPDRGRIVPELAKHGINTFRELVVSPWRVVYTIEQFTVYIKLVADGRRDLDDLLFRRIMR